MSDLGNMLLVESQKAVDACFKLWKQKPRDIATILRLKNAIDHLYNVERRLGVEHNDAAFGGAAGR